MTLEESLDFIRTEFLKELDTRKELLDEIAELQEDNEQLKRDLKAYRSFYPMKMKCAENVCLLTSAPMKIELKGKDFVLRSTQN